MGISCFVCTTPYQIITACVLAKSFGEQADLYIIPQFIGAEEYRRQIEKMLLFSKVTVPDLSEIEKYKMCTNKIVFGMGIAINYLRIKKIIPRLLGNQDYDSIYISSQANIGRLICLYFMKEKREKVNIAYFDDGEGSYDDEAIYNAQGLDKKIRYLLFGKRSIKLSKTVYLYSPKLFKELNHDNYIVKKIPDWKGDIGLLEMVNSIVGFKTDYSINEKYILIDTIVSETFSDDGISAYIAIRDTLIKCLGDKLIIKRHPRDHSAYLENVKYYAYQHIPFEVICANSDVANKILITASSTAVLMPKLLFDTEPTVILLHKLINIKVGDKKRRNQLMESLINQYTDQTKVIIPDTMSEFEMVLASL